MNTVLIAVDDSPASERAVQMARGLLTGRQAEVTLFHVLPRHLIYGKGGPVMLECYDPAQERANSVALLEARAAQLAEGGVGPTIKQEIAAGDPADLILAAAKRDGTDLLIMGSQGQNAVQRAVHGSVSTKVSKQARCAVLIAHPAQPRGHRAIGRRRLATA